MSEQGVLITVTILSKSFAKLNRTGVQPNLVIGLFGFNVYPLKVTRLKPVKDLGNHRICKLILRK